MREDLHGMGEINDDGDGVVESGEPDSPRQVDDVK
jgi:hypothetical protein